MPAVDDHRRTLAPINHDLPRNPLYDLGYAQIGCAPCTRPVAPGGHERDGRWDGSLKVECGLHAPEPAWRG